MGRLQGKVAFITGGGSGIGRVAVERFAQEGAQVVVAEINPEYGSAAADSARAMGSAAGGDAFAVTCDVGDRASVQAALDATIARYGKLDILYNNAGGSTLRDAPVTEAPEDEFWRTIRLDLFGTFLCCKLAIPLITRAGGGSIINTTSIAALKALPNRDCYTAAKGGVAALTRSMAVEYGASKIRVNALAPGLTLTDRARNMLSKISTDDLAKLSASQVLGELLPIEVANMALFLASDEARQITGQILAVDGGASIS